MYTIDQPSDPGLVQCEMFSSWYASCIGQAGVSVYLCGWTVTWELAAGTLTVLPMWKQSILELWTNYSISLLTMTKHTCDNPFTNILDKGYWFILLGKQISVQPTYDRVTKALALKACCILKGCQQCNLGTSLLSVGKNLMVDQVGMYVPEFGFGIVVLYLVTMVPD